MVPDFPPRFRKFLEQDEVFRLLQTAGSESLKKLLSHFQSKNYVFTRSDLEIILKKEGDELDQLLKSGGYKPLEFSTGEDLDQAIESTTFIVPGWLPRGHLTAIVSSPGLGKTYIALAVAKIITTGQEKWIDGDTSVTVNSKKVIWCEAEGFQAGLKDRIKQLEIPPNEIILPFKDPLQDFRLEWHLDNLSDAVAYHDPDLVIIDSLRGSHRKARAGAGSRTSSTATYRVRPETGHLDRATSGS